MLHTKAQCIKAIKTIAKALGDLNDQVVYVGGAVVGLYADDPAAPEVRPTKDIDIVLEITSASHLEQLRQRFAARGIYFAKDEKVMCRFTYKNILLDVMSTKAINWAPANPWFKVGYHHAQIISLGDVKIKIMPLAYYLATKFYAFSERGSDPRTSSDFEDIVYIMDNRSKLYQDIIDSSDEVKSYLTSQFKAILRDDTMQEAVLAHLEPAVQTERFEMLINRLQTIVSNIK